VESYFDAMLKSPFWLVMRNVNVTGSSSMWPDAMLIISLAELNIVVDTNSH
jgi:hypothetical protein